MTGVVEVLLLSGAGFLVGVATGLVPGLHVNNAALLLASAPLLALLPLSPEGAAMLVVAASVSHTFFDIVPSVLVGAPEPSTALAVLPGHRLLMEGRAAEAVRLSAVGSGGAVVLALVLAFPAKLVAEAVYPVLVSGMGWVLLAVAAVMVVTERGEPGVFGVRTRRDRAVAVGRGTGVLVLSGALGFVAMRGEALGAVWSPLGAEASVLFPLLTGLFGTSTLLLSLAGSAAVPEQVTGPVEVRSGAVARSVLGGGLSGAVVGWVPGVTSAQAAALAGEVSGAGDGRGEGSARSYLVSVSAVNSSNAVFTLVALYTVGRVRSGAMAAFDDLVEVGAWGAVPPRTLVAALLAVAVSALLSYGALTRLSGGLARWFAGLDYGRVSLGVVAALVLGVAATTGPFGLGVLVVGTAVGLLPPLLGVRRTHCMGSILLPVAGYFLGVV